MTAPIAVRIPAAWWSSLGDAEADALFDNHLVLDHGQCIRLWEMLGRTDRVPFSFTLTLREEEEAEMIEAMKRRKTLGER